MKRVTAFLLIAGVCFAQACSNNSSNTNRTDSSATTATDSNTTAYGNTDTSMSNMNNDTASSSSTKPGPYNKDVADFTMKAATGGLMEVQLGQIAQTKAMDPRIKDFGSMMVQDHSQANDELKRLATSKNINLPTTLSADMQKEIDDLNAKTGKEFDKAYMNMMLKDHKKDVKEFEKAGKDLTDADLKNFAMKTLPTLQKHLDSAQAITGKK
jgi:putative membrane protein